VRVRERERGREREREKGANKKYALVNLTALCRWRDDDERAGLFVNEDIIEGVERWKGSREEKENTKVRESREEQKKGGEERSRREEKRMNDHLSQEKEIKKRE